MLNSTPIHQVTDQDVIVMRDSIEKFVANFTVEFNRFDMNPRLQSTATKELATLNGKEEQELLESAYSMGTQSIDYAGDHLLAFLKCLQTPAVTVAPFVCVRSLMECCAIGAFLLEPSITALERLDRSFAFRRNGYDQQKKFAESLKSPDKEQIKRGVVQKSNQRDKRLDDISKRIGLKPSRRNNTTVYGMNWPGITELTKIALQQDSDYRLLSAFAHGHHWAISQFSYQVRDHPTEVGKKVLEKHFLPQGFLYLGGLAIQAFSTATNSLWQLYGWDKSELTKVFAPIEHYKLRP